MKQADLKQILDAHREWLESGYSKGARAYLGGAHKPRLLDLFSGAGGAAMGYHRAGFDIVGVDIKPQPRYPFEFHQGGAFEYLYDHAKRFDVIHASPPCQAYSKAQNIRGNSHPKYIKGLRYYLKRIGLPYIIENVVGAPLEDPVMLCGSMFGLRLYRHRLFESSVKLMQPEHPPHTAPSVKMGRPPKAHEIIQVVGHFSGADAAREAMGTPWMSKENMREAIPPAYTEFIGRQLIAVLENAA